MNIEDKLIPNHSKLLIDENNTRYTIIFDVELDPIRFDFYDDGTIRLLADDLHYVDLDEHILKLLIKLKKEALVYYSNLEIDEL